MHELSLSLYFTHNWRLTRSRNLVLYYQEVFTHLISLDTKWNWPRLLSVWILAFLPCSAYHYSLTPTLRYNGMFSFNTTLPGHFCYVSKKQSPILYFSSLHKWVTTSWIHSNFTLSSFFPKYFTEYLRGPRQSVHYVLLCPLFVIMVQFQFNPILAFLILPLIFLSVMFYFLIILDPDVYVNPDPFHLLYL